MMLDSPARIAALAAALALWSLGAETRCQSLYNPEYLKPIPGFTHPQEGSGSRSGSAEPVRRAAARSAPLHLKPGQVLLIGH